MKKTLILACTALLAASGVKAQDTYFATGFDEGIPSSFTLHDEDGRTPSTDMQNLGFAVGTPWIVTTEGDDGNKVACSTSWYKNAGASDDWMVTHAISVKSAKAILRWRSRASDKDYRDGFSVYISEKGTAVADFDKSTPFYTTSKENYAWTEHSLSLADYEGKTIYIAFVNDSKDKTCLYVDDLFVGIPSCVSLALDFGRVLNGYGETTLSGKVTSTDGKDHTGFTVGYRIGGKTVEQQFNTTLKSGVATSFSLNETFSIDRNATIPYEAWVKCDGDSTGISSKLSAFPYKLVAEEVTGTWCGFCIRGIVNMKNMKEQHPDSFIGIAIHSTNSSWPDAMAAGVEDYLNYIYTSCAITGYPHCVYSRNPLYSIDPGYLPDYYTTLMENQTNNCGVQLSASYDAESNKISATTDVYFAEAVEKADYKLAYVLVENNVHRTNADLGIPEGKATGYEQSNYYAGGSYGEMGGYENLPATVPADQMWYQDVARGIWPSCKGESGIIPTTIESGAHFTHDYAFDLPDNVLEKENTELIVLLLDKNGIIANADKVAISGTATAISDLHADQPAATDAPAYNLAGMRVGNDYKGIVIVNGRKMLRR